MDFAALPPFLHAQRDAQDQASDTLKTQPCINPFPQGTKRRGAGRHCGDFAVGVNDFLTVGAKPRLSESVLALEVC